MALGFAKSLNLAESENALSAQGIFNNLGGEGISSDILLFSNNLKTTSLVRYGSSVGDGNYTASSKAYYSTDEVVFRAVIFNPTTAIANNILTVPNHRFKTGEKVVYDNDGGTAVSKSGGRWAQGDVFYVVVQTSNTIKLAASYNDAIAAVPTTLTFGGATTTGEEHRLDLAAIDLPSSDPDALTYIVIPSTTVGYKPFTNGTLLYTVSNSGIRTFYKVRESNSVDRFRLYTYDPTASDGYGALATWHAFEYLNEKVFRREDPVTFAAMTNLSKDRPTLDDGSSPYDQVTRFTDSRDPSKSVTFLKRENLNDRDAEIDIAINIFYNKESKSVVNYKPTVLKKTLEVLGKTVISNNDSLELNVGGVTDDTMPGLYIMADGLKERAFSSLKNPWAVATETVGTHGSLNVLRTVNDDGSVSDSQNADVFNLIFEGPNPSLVVDNTAVNTSTAGTGFSVADNWTHKVEIEVDGETYYLLLLDDDVATTNNLWS